MSFVSLSFFAFLTGIVFLYYMVPKKYQWQLLLVVSYYFYILAAAKMLPFLFVTTVSTYLAGRSMDKVNQKSGRRLERLAKKQFSREKNANEKNRIVQNAKRSKKKILYRILLLNFGILFLLKYFNVLSGIISFFPKLLGSGFHMPVINLFLPLGISFYTFQAAGYLIDIYRNKYRAEKSFLKYTLFLSFFPQIVQGPISRFDELSEQLYRPHDFEYAQVKHGMELVIWGCVKKLVIANRLAMFSQTVWGNTDRYQGFYIVIAALLSYIELYADFSGGIDIARGAAQMLDIRLANNFRQPFFSFSLAEFWRRWHISLNNWWRDYIFYPVSLSKGLSSLGRKSRQILGNYVGKRVPTILALFTVRFINSIWHGASWVFFIGGIYHGIILSSSFLLEPWFQKCREKWKIRTDCISYKAFQMVRTYILISIPRIISETNSLREVGRNIGNAFAKWNPWILFDGSLYTLGVSRKEWSVLCLFLLLGFCISIVQERGISIREKLDEQNTVFRWAVYMAGVFSVILFGVYGTGYDLADFQYMNF